jgi:mutator protein MutT
MRQITTLAIIENDDQVLLAMKKRGFGAGWWNGYGGKVDDGESIESAMVRELAEESGVVAKTYRQRAVIEFEFKDKDLVVEMHVFEVSSYQGQVVETEEMAPRWFNKTALPFDKMWPADKEWIPLFLAGKNLRGRVIFDGQTKEVLDANFQPVS